ncbi:MAG TPA: TPM domain-containing protein [Cyclobacteriaceae bacterium]|jgi:uncharacterized protein|nr:TPM domain-containing protein [Cyclobacteriaceae bacterium]
MKPILISLFLVLSFVTQAQTTIENLPNQKLINGSYVSNPDHILSDDAVIQIDTLLKSLETKTSVQVAVVAVESIGDADVFDFAQQLFKTWGIGAKDKDNGLLLLLVKGNHTVRFHTGYGLEGVLPDVICKRIQRDFMVPEFKNDNYDGGVLAGLKEVSKILSDPTYASELKSKSTDVSDWTGFMILLGVFAGPILLIIYFIKAHYRKFADSKKPKYTEYPEMRLNRWTWIMEFAGIPIIILCLFGFSNSDNPQGFSILVLYFYFMCTLFHRLIRMKQVINRMIKTESYYEIVEFIRKSQWYWFFMGLLFPFPFFIYFFYHLARKKIYRNHSRSCKACGGTMQKLSEKLDDEFLTPAQQMEEKLKSIDYDVWKCEACSHTEHWNYPNRFSKYSECPYCKTHAFYSSGHRTIVSATYHSSGRGEETHTCKYCSRTKTSTYTIAQLVASTSSSSSGSSSSSSSGGSWGGGSSGGGGASSSW